MDHAGPPDGRLAHEPEPGAGHRGEALRAAALTGGRRLRHEGGIGQRRSGPETRPAIQQIALRLFTAQGYEATSMHEIAAALDIRKASLYYHFGGKEDILRSLFEQRSAEAAQPGADPDGGAEVGGLVLRGQLHGLRFRSANPVLARDLDAQSGRRIGSALTTLVDTLAGLLPHPAPADALQLRMALLSINAAIEAAAQGDVTDEEILSAAHTSAEDLIDALLRRSR